MEDPETPGASLFFTQRIKRYVKDKKTSKVNKLNTSLASKIKNKLINNSSIIKISLKHNNRALAQALSIEKGNSRKLTTEKMLLQKEVEKLNFQNAFLRQKLNHLNKSLIEIEAFMSSNLISAIEMTSHLEEYQSPFLLPSSQRKSVGNQLDLLRHSFGREIPHIRPPQLPMRVLLTSAEDDDDDDDRKAFQKGSDMTIKKVSDSLTPVASKVSLSNQLHLELLQSPEKNNQKIDDLDNLETNFSLANELSTENQAHPEENPKSSSTNERDNIQDVRQEKVKRSRGNSQSGNVTERKKRLPSWESSNLPAAIPLAVDLQERVISNNLLNCYKIDDNSVETSSKTQQNGLCQTDSQFQSVSELNSELPAAVVSDEQQQHKTVYEADMDLTASKISKIITVQTAANNKSSLKIKASGKKAFRKVKDSSTENNREKSKIQQPKTSSYWHSEERDKDREKSTSFMLANSNESEDQKLTLETEQPAQLNTLRNIMCQKVSEQNVEQISQQNDKKKKVRKTYVVNDEKKVSFFFSTSGESHQDNNFTMGHSSQTLDKGRDVRRTFVVNNLDKDTCFPSKNDNETFSGMLENDLQTVANCTKTIQNLSDCRTQISLGGEKQPSKQSTTDLNTKPPKKPRKQRTSEFLSEVNQPHENNDKVVHHKESEVEDLNSKTSKPPKKAKYQGRNIKNMSCKEVISKTMENYDQSSDLQKLGKKYNKTSSGKAVSLLVKPEPKTFMQPADLTQQPVSLESGLKHSLTDFESHPKSQIDHQKEHTLNTTTALSKTFSNSFRKVAEESECNFKLLNKKREYKSKKSRKTYLVSSVDQIEFREEIPETIEERLIPCDSEQDNHEQNLENEKTFIKIEPDLFSCRPVMENTSCHLKSLTQTYPSNKKQSSPCTTVKVGLLNSGIPVTKDQKLTYTCTLKESPIFQVSDIEQKCVSQEETEETVVQVRRRTETIGKSTKALQDLTNISFDSHNSSPKSQSPLDEMSSVLPTKRRRVVVCYKEPSLMRKLRQGDEFTNITVSKPKESKGRTKKNDKESLPEIL